MRILEVNGLQDKNHQWSSLMCGLLFAVITGCLGFCKFEGKLLIRKSLPSMVGHTCNPSPREVEARDQGSRPGSSI